MRMIKEILLNSSMGRQCNNTKILISGIICLLISACSLKPTIIEEPVLLGSKPNVSVRYTYDKVTLIIPVNVLEGEPTAYKVSLFQKGKMATPIFEKLFFPEDSIKMILPENIWNTENFGNVMTIFPIGDDFEGVTQMFHISGPGIYYMDLVHVRKDPITIKGLVLNRRLHTPIKNAEVTISDTIRTLKTISTDSLGFFRTELNHIFLGRDDLTIQVDTKNQFPDYSEHLPSLDTKNHHIDVLLGMSASMAENGTLFRVNTTLVPFRQGPENGSPIQMMLSMGDMFLVTKVSGDRSFGFIEIIDKQKGVQEEFEGWILSKYLEYIE